jgi:hypothetical protein
MSPLRTPLPTATALAIFLLVVTVQAGGCGESSAGSISGPSSSSSVPAKVVIITRTSTATSSEDTVDHLLKVSASCHAGEQMLAGGYSLEDVFESDYFLLATYPAAPGMWTVRTNSGSHYQLQTIVYCLSGYPLLGLQILRSETCPAGMVETAGGFSSTSTNGPPETMTSYVICGSRHLIATAKGFLLGSTEVECTNQSTGNNFSETRSFAYTCSVAESPTPTATTVKTSATQTFQGVSASDEGDRVHAYPGD